MKILLAYDGSDCSEVAITDLADAALPVEGELLVVTIADVLMPVGYGWLEDPASLAAPLPVHRAWGFVRDSVAKAKLTADAGAARVREVMPGWRVTSSGYGDSPVWGILSKAREFGADLIVAGSHGMGLMQRLFLGSVSHKLLAEAPCSVRIVRPTRAGLERRVLVAVDGSVDSARVIREVESRVWPAGMEFVVVGVVDSQFISAAILGPFGGMWVAPEDQEAADSAQRMVAQFAGSMRAAGLVVRTEVLRGEAKEVLVQQADQLHAGMIFVGAHGLHHGVRRALGTVAAAVAARAHCPVEVVRGNS